MVPSPSKQETTQTPKKQGTQTIKTAATRKDVKIQKNQESPPHHNKSTSPPTPPPLTTESTSETTPHEPKSLFGRLRSGRKEKQGYQKLEESHMSLEPRSSIILPHLQESEKLFLDLVNDGDLEGVKRLLNAKPGLNLNCTNFQGVSALHTAVQNGDDIMVEFLLTQKNIDIGDSVLIAVRDNQKEILKMLLDRLQRTSPGLEFVGATHSSDFPDHITPLILAAQCGHYEIIEMLIERGHKIAKPHPPDCLCQECRERLEQDDLLHSETLRINLYRAVSNPAYICHSTHDPILTAFELSRELRECALIVRAFRAAYNQLAEEISAFAVELIGCCRSTAEMELILRQKSGLNGPASFAFPRLILAMDYKQKEFVAHPNTQQVIESSWRGDWYEWRLKPPYIRYLYPFYRLLVLPIMTIMCMILPRNEWVRHWKIPLNKMISHNTSYFVFLILLFFESNIDKSEQKRGPPKSGLEPFIVLYVIGYIYGAVRMCALRGPRRYFRELWSWHEVISLLLFVITFIFWLAAYVDVMANDQADLERKYWDSLDPTLVAEGTFAVATIMSFFRLMFLCRLNPYLGPLQISLGKMSIDVAKYITLFLIIILSFTVGLSRFYQYYDGMVQVDETYEIKTEQVSSFVDFASTLKTFFWALFCMAPLESADVIIENLPGPEEGTTITNKHTFTEAIGYIAFAVFEFLTVIVILNMLIATMSNTFQRVTDNVDIEWIFGKTEFYIEYMYQTTLPPPFNLVPTAVGLASVLEWFSLCFSKNNKDKRAGCSFAHCCYIEREVDEQVAKDFPILMTQLVQRYFREKDTNIESTENELEVIKKELAEIVKYMKQS